MSVKSELEKLIAKSLYDAAGKLGKAAIAAIKNSGLTQGGRGLPDALVDQLLEDIKWTVSNFTPALSDGAASWDPAGSSGLTVPFMLAGTVSKSVANRNKNNWATTCKKSPGGARLIAAFNDDETFTATVTAVIPQLVVAFTGLAVGDFFPRSDNPDYGVVLLTGVRDMEVAPKDTTTFSAAPIVFFLRGPEHKVRSDYKTAKKQAKSLGKLQAPKWGPFLGA